MKAILFCTAFLFSFSLIAQTSSSTLMEDGSKAFTNHNYSLALELYNKAYKADKKNVEALFWRGRAKVELLDIEGAIKDFGNVLKTFPSHYGALLNRGNLYASQREFEKALNDYSEAKLINSDSIGVYLNRGITYFKMKKFDLAIADYTKAIKIKPNYIYPYHLRSECYNYSGNIEGAMNDLEKIMELDSTDNTSKINLAFCYISTKQFDKAAIAYQQLYQSNKKNPYVLNNYGYVKHVLGDTKSGLEFILESLQILPSNSYAYKYLAEIYQSQGDVEKACESASTGIKLGFTNSYGNELIDFQKKNCR